MTRSAENWPDNNPYGRFRLDLDTRLDLVGAGAGSAEAESVVP